MTIEHAAFVEEHIQDGQAGVRKTAVDVLNPDVTLMEKAGVADELKRYQADIKDLFGKTGISQMYLLRSLPICEYSFVTPAFRRRQCISVSLTTAKSRCPCACSVRYDAGW